MGAGPVYSFGPFQLDRGACRLTRDGAAVAVAARHLDVLAALLARAGTVVAKDTLVEQAWHGLAVTDNSLEQAISALRRTLGVAPGGDGYIETVPRQGYRFTGAVAVREARASDAELDAILAPHRAWIEGRAALESLDAGRMAAARAAFARALEASPGDPVAHVGMANACVMQFEASRAGAVPDAASLALAAQHAREACRLDPRSGEAWATEGFVLERTGRSTEAQAALVRAVSLEPDNWRHHFRLSLVSWGEARLRAARRTLALLPGLPLAHWLAATVLVARQNLDDAEAELRLGLAAMYAPTGSVAVRFPGVALEWLLGLIVLARGADDAALACFERELALEPRNHLYAREACANAWYAVGAVRRRRGEAAAAGLAFHEALARVPRHVAAAVLGQAAHLPPGSFDAAIAESVGRAVSGDVPAAVATVGRALSVCGPGSQGWLIPVEPVLDVARHRDAWAPVLAQLRSRAA